MDRAQTATLLAMVSALDRQPVDEGMVEMWFRVLGDFSFDRCEAALIPAYKESRSGFITAKAVWDVVRREGSAPSPRGWVAHMHVLGVHFECRPGEFEGGCE